MRSLLADHLGSEQTAAEYRRRAETAERQRQRAARWQACHGFDARRWAERGPRNAPTRAAVTPDTVRALVRAELAPLRAEIARLAAEQRGLRAETIQAITETVRQ